MTGIRCPSIRASSTHSRRINEMGDIQFAIRMLGRQRKSPFFTSYPNKIMSAAARRVKTGGIVERVREEIDKDLGLPFLLLSFRILPSSAAFARPEVPALFVESDR